ncbi:MAG TPA: hypothetical protein VLK25_05255 [Allosphingosinicella sp.]|nr:hypothetical protein [Allosphingosinicella sp.]
MATTSEEYLAKADAASAELAAATSEAERARLRRAIGVYRRLSTHGAEAAERAAMAPPPRIKPEKPSGTPERTIPNYFKL